MKWPFHPVLPLSIEYIFISLLLLEVVFGRVVNCFFFVLFIISTLTLAFPNNSCRHELV